MDDRTGAKRYDKNDIFYAKIHGGYFVMKILVTGAAGFIGMHTVKRLLADGHEVIGLDNMNDYYDVSLKLARLSNIGSPNQFSFVQGDLADQEIVTSLFRTYQPNVVINLAAQAGVRFSLENPHSYIQANLVGFTNLLEACRHFDIQNLIFASSSSVYGLNKTIPFLEEHHANHPLSLYGATKKANEVMAHSYANLFGLPCTGLRFFTVYGPWGRPDMSLFLFVKAILADQAIDVFNNGQMFRDFTYIDDIVESVVRLVIKPATADEMFEIAVPNPATSTAPYRLFNIGNGQPVPLMDFIAAIEKAVGKKAIKHYLPMQAGDVITTSADTTLLSEWVGFQPNTPVSKGVECFVEWYRGYYGV